MKPTDTIELTVRIKASKPFRSHLMVLESVEKTLAALAREVTDGNGLCPSGCGHTKSIDVDCGSSDIQRDRRFD